MSYWKPVLVIICIIFIMCLIAYSVMGAGGFKRMVTLTGIYAVCKPGGYDAVCFLDSDSKEGGLSCLPLNAVGGECRK